MPSIITWFKNLSLKSQAKTTQPADFRDKQDFDWDIYHQLWDLPEGADYAVDATELDLEDISPERIATTESLLNHEEIWVQFAAARILTCWGNDKGFEHLSQLYQAGKVEGQIPHRLHPYDASKEYILDAYLSYWTSRSDQGLGKEAREKIAPYIHQLIREAGQEDFSLGIFPDMVLTYAWNEYHESLRAYLKALLESGANRQVNYKIADILPYFKEKDADFAKGLLEQYGKNWSDYEGTSS